jgi:hypothetical protein
MDTIALDLRGQRAVVAAQPITRQQYRMYLAAAGKPAPAPRAMGERSAAPVTYVSQLDALEYCRWLGAKEGRRYRLPVMAELEAMADEIAQEGIDLKVWPYMHQPYLEYRDSIKLTYLCEWTQETDELPRIWSAASACVLCSVFYPPWARSSSNASRTQAHLAASERYSFVTFRVVYNP